MFGFKCHINILLKFRKEKNFLHNYCIFFPEFHYHLFLSPLTIIYYFGVPGEAELDICMQKVYKGVLLDQQLSGSVKRVLGREESWNDKEGFHFSLTPLKAGSGLQTCTSSRQTAWVFLPSWTSAVLMAYDPCNHTGPPHSEEPHVLV